MLVGAAVLAALVFGRLFAELFGGSPDRFSRADAEQYLQENPGVPFVLPRALPPGYTWDGPHTFAGDGQEVTQRTSMFLPEDLAAEALVRVCAQRPGRDQCEHGDKQVRRSLPWLDVRIVLSGEREDVRAAEEFWADVPLTTRLDVDWLPAD